LATSGKIIKFCTGNHVIVYIVNMNFMYLMRLDKILWPTGEGEGSV